MQFGCAGLAFSSFATSYVPVLLMTQPQDVIEVGREPGGAASDGLRTESNNGNVRPKNSITVPLGVRPWSDRCVSRTSFSFVWPKGRRMRSVTLCSVSVVRQSRH